MPAHGVDVVGDVEGDHHLAAHAVGVAVDHRHDRLDPGLERRIGRVAHQLVVLDEVDVGLAERVDERRRVLGGEPDGRLDDRADSGRPCTFVTSRVPATPKAGPGKLRRIVVRKVEIENAQAR